MKEEAVDAQQVKRWKEQYGQLYQTVIGEDLFIWRRFSRKDYKEILQETEALADRLQRLLSRRELFCIKGCVYPETATLEALLSGKAGLAETLSEAIMEESGFQLGKTTKL